MVAVPGGVQYWPVPPLDTYLEKSKSWQVLLDIKIIVLLWKVYGQNNISSVDQKQKWIKCVHVRKG